MPRGKKGSGTPPKKAKYLIYTDEGAGKLSLAKRDVEGRNAQDALSNALNDGLKAGVKAFVIIPDRNLTRIKAEVEQVKKVKLSNA